IYKIVAGVLHFHMNITFGSTTNFGSGVTTSDNWQFSLTSGGVYSVQSDFSSNNMPIGFGYGDIGSGRVFPVMVRAGTNGTDAFLDLSGGYTNAAAVTNGGTIDSLTPGTWTSGATL